MTENYAATTLTYVIVNNTDSDFPIEPGETWKFIVSVETTFDAWQQMEKVKLQANQFNHEIMNVFLDGLRFNARAWYTDGQGEDKIEYDENIKINNLTDHTLV